VTTAAEPIPVHPTNGPIHTWFGLTYSNYLVLPRSLMQSMPIEWQERMAACLNEMRGAFDHVEQAKGYEVHAATMHEVDALTDEQRAERGITEHWYDADEPTDLSAGDLAEWKNIHELPDAPVYRDADGQELDYDHSVQIRCEDPVPHYNRGRTYIEPRTTA
jgi:hypothetical protein